MIPHLLVCELCPAHGLGVGAVWRRGSGGGGVVRAALLAGCVALGVGAGVGEGAGGRGHGNTGPPGPLQLSVAGGGRGVVMGIK